MIRRSLTLLRWLRQHLGRCALAVALAVLVVVGAAEAGLQGRALYHFRAARLAAEHHRLRAARQHLDACLGAWPRSAPAHLLAAQVARWSGALDDAERHLEAAEQREGDRTPAARLERVLLQA